MIARFFKPILFSFLFFTPLSFERLIQAKSDELPPRHAWVLDSDYQGPYKESYQKLRWAIPGLIRQTTINLAVRVGLDFQEGWRYPLTVGFVDGSPAGHENVLAYVLLSSNGEVFQQRLNINLAAYTQSPFNFEKVLAHELIHAMLNDALGGMRP